MFKQIEKLSLNKQKDLAEQIAELLSCGIPLNTILKIIIKRDQKIKTIIQKLTLHLQNGLVLSEAVKKELKYFDFLFPFFIKLGEDSGNLSLALKDYAHFLQKRIAVTEQIKKQMFYPALILIAATFSGFLMIQFLLPTMINLFEESQIAVPGLLTKIILFKAFVQNNIFWIIPIIGTIIFYIYSKDKNFLFTQLNKIKIIKTWNDKIFAWRLFQNLAILINSGLPLLTSISLQKQLYSQKAQHLVLAKLILKIKNGNSISQALVKENWLEESFIQIINTAEHSGNLTNALSKIAAILEKEIEQTVKTFLKWLEPATTLILGIFVAIFLLGLFYPLTKILSSL